MKFRIVIAIGALLLLAVAGCRDVLPSNRHLQMRQGPSRSTAEARRAFDHARHQKAFTRAEVTCVDCHRFDLKIDAANPEAARSISSHGLNPSGGACHSCHLSGPNQMAGASDTCATCHENLAPLLPEDHQIGWVDVHARVAHVDPLRCESCHRQAFCIDCHQRRDDVQTRMHDRNFRFTHSVVARANPMQCGSCHRQDFCSNCHQQGR